MKNEILKLRLQGKSYKEICETLGCSKSTVSFHCGKDQKEKTRRRLQRRRKTLVILHKVDHFQSKRLKDKAEDFQREKQEGTFRRGKRDLVFSWHDVIEKYGWETTCYLTGRLIQLREPKTYHFDHLIPPGRGGDNSLENLRIACKAANVAKSDLLVEEFIELCIDVVRHHGYLVEKK
jgi:5-methylcytosine-specific restriction endonuclease McrA